MKAELLTIVLVGFRTIGPVEWPFNIDFFRRA